MFLFQILQAIVVFFLKFLGFGLIGIGEFESSLEFRRKINSRIQTEKKDDDEDFLLPLFDGSLQECYKVAEEANGILLVIFLNSNDGDSRQFESSVLAENGFRKQINEITFKTPILILSDVINHYHFKESNSFKCEHFPSIFIKTKFQNKFQTVLSYEGFLDSSKLTSLIHSVLLACESEIAQAAEIHASRSLQNEQDAAYFRSLEIDKEKLKKRSFEQISEKEQLTVDTEKDNPNYCVQRTNEDSIHNNDRLNERISRAHLEVENEPEKESIGIFRFQFLFPDGTKRIRSFNSESTTKSLFDYIFSSGLELRSERIVIRSIEPRIEISEENSLILLKEIEGIGLGKGIKLFIEYI